MQLRAWLDKGEAVLRAGPHPEKARRDAELLLQHLTRRNKAWLLAHGDHEIPVGDSEEYVRLLDRRLKGEPIQYIFGEAEFYGLPFHLTPDVLIPRPETELLVETAVQLIPVFHHKPKRIFEFRVVPTFKHGEERERSGDPRTAGWPPRILDVGTGTGAIAISIAHDWSEAGITAVDVSLAALEVARSNAEHLGFADQIRFLQGDLLEPVAGEQFDLIVSNPPYVPTADRESLSIEVREFEPALALFAGEDGLEVYRRLIPAAFAVLVSGGLIALEIGCGQRDAVGSLLSGAGFGEVEFRPDLNGIPRVALARRP